MTDRRQGHRRDDGLPLLAVPADRASDVHPLHVLQRQAGNAAVTGAVLAVQCKGDPKEREEELLRLRAGAVDRARVPTRGNIAFETAKPTAVIGSGLGTGVGTGNMNIGSSIIGGASLVDAGLTFRAGYSRRAAAARSGDRAGGSLGAGKMRSAGWGAMGSASGVSQSGVRIGHAAGSTAAGLGVAAGALGIVGSGLTALQGLWRVYKATGKLWALSALGMYTAAGERWKERVTNREKWKLGVGALKVALGALGIAAGALAIVSNPVGWAVGIAAAVAGGAWALSKIGAKLSDLWARRKAKKEIQKRDPDGAKRKEAKAMADAVARECSANAKVSGEMVDALRTGQPHTVAARAEAIEAMAATVGRADARELPKPTRDDYEAHDAFSLLAVLNIPPEEALSASGQERIEKKLSVTESA